MCDIGLLVGLDLNEFLEFLLDKKFQGGNS